MDTTYTNVSWVNVGRMVVTLPNSEAPIEMDIDLSYFRMEVDNEKYWEGYYGNIYIRIHKTHNNNGTRQNNY